MMLPRGAVFARTLAAAYALVACSILSPPAAAQGTPVTIFAAASLKTALDTIVADWQTATGKKATVSYAASSALARQIENGAPAQIFISADLDWMDYLAGKKLITAESRADLLGNRIVLIAPKDTMQTIEIKPGFDLLGLLGNGRLSMANVDAVPAGKYGKAALEKLGVWDTVAGRIAQAENVRAALLLVSRGETPAGIVYQTDAASDPKVRIIGTFPEGTHPPIIYPMARLANDAHPDTADFLTFIRSSRARSVFEAQGFTVYGAPRS